MMTVLTSCVANAPARRNHRPMDTFILRVWSTDDADRPLAGAVEHLTSGEQTLFSGPEDLARFLEATCEGSAALVIGELAQSGR